MREELFRNFLIKSCNFDPAHDLSHTERVVKNANLLLKSESANADVVIPAAWLHDCVVVPKDSPNRNKASVFAAEKAIPFLKKLDLNHSVINEIAHAIEAHSYSAGIVPKTLEAKIVQDADRLDALGAIGISRCLMVGAQLERDLYHPEDPFCNNRKPDDSKWTIDHFYTKLFKLPESMKTESAKLEAQDRIEFMKLFLNRLKDEV